MCDTTCTVTVWSGPNTGSLAPEEGQWNIKKKVQPTHWLKKSMISKYFKI